MPNLAVAIFSVCVTILLGQSIDRNDCKWIHGGWGEMEACQAGSVLVGACASGNNPGCNDLSHASKCCNVTGLNEAEKRMCYTEYGHGYGSEVECKGTDAGQGVCASGGDRDCMKDGTEHSTGIFCCDDSGITVHTDECAWKYGDWREYIECANNAVVKGFCSGGEAKRCENDNYSHGIKCCLYN